MAASPVRGALLLCAFLQLCSLLGGQVPSCQEVRTAFHSVHPGSKLVPETPVSGKALPLEAFIPARKNSNLRASDYEHGSYA